MCLPFVLQPMILYVTSCAIIRTVITRSAFTDSLLYPTARKTSARDCGALTHSIKMKAYFIDLKLNEKWLGIGETDETDNCILHCKKCWLKSGMNYNCSVIFQKKL